MQVIVTKRNYCNTGFVYYEITSKITSLNFDVVNHANGIIVHSYATITVAANYECSIKIVLLQDKS